MSTKLVIAEPFKVDYEPLSLPQPAAGQIRTRTVLSGISHGTEMAAFRGTSPFIRRTMTPERMFVDKQPDTPPFYPFRWAGYDNIGVVEEVGPGVSGVKVGDRVWSTAQHQTHAVLTIGHEMHVLPPTVSTADAVMVSLTGVALVAVNDAEIHVGDTVAIFGGGVVGQLAAQLAVTSGARRAFVVEPIAERRQAAIDSAGAIGIDPAQGLPGLLIRQANDNLPPDVVIDCTGSSKALAQAIQSAPVGGTVVAAGFYNDATAQVCLGEEFLHNRITIKASMGVWGCPLRPPFWDRPRVIREVVALIAAGKLNFRHLTATTVPYTQAQQAYELIHQQPQKYLKVMLSYE